MKIPGGFRIDDPSFHAVRSLVSWVGVTTADGAADGSNLTDIGLANEPSYDGLAVKILSGPAAGAVRGVAVHNAVGQITFSDPFVTPAGVPIQITAGTLFMITGSGGSGGGSGPTPGAPAQGLFYSGVVTAVPGAGQFTIPSLAGLGANKFVVGAGAGSIPYSAFVIRDAGGAGAAPQGEIQQIAAYDTATGAFTAAAFTAAVGVGDEILVVNPALASTIAALVILAAQFTLQNAGGTLTATGAEDTVVLVNAPAAVFKPLRVQIDLTDMEAGDNTIIRLYYRIAAAGGLILGDTVTYNGAQAVPLINVDLGPNRYGFHVTLEQDAGVNRDYDYAYFFED